MGQNFPQPAYILAANERCDRPQLTAVCRLTRFLYITRSTMFIAAPRRNRQHLPKRRTITRGASEIEQPSA